METLVARELLSKVVHANTCTLSTFDLFTTKLGYLISLLERPATEKVNYGHLKCMSREIKSRPLDRLPASHGSSSSSLMTSATKYIAASLD